MLVTAILQYRVDVSMTSSEVKKPIRKLFRDFIQRAQERNEKKKELERNLLYKMNMLEWKLGDSGRQIRIRQSKRCVQ